MTDSSAQLLHGAADDIQCSQSGGARIAARGLQLPTLPLSPPPATSPGRTTLAELFHPPARCSALELLQDASHQRFASVQASAVEQADAVGEADLRRLKRQFSSLKNTFLHYEVKNEFLAGKRCCKVFLLFVIALTAFPLVTCLLHCLLPCLPPQPTPCLHLPCRAAGWAAARRRGRAAAAL